MGGQTHDLDVAGGDEHVVGGGAGGVELGQKPHE